MRFRTLVFALLVAAAAPAHATFHNVVIPAQFDRWMYPFNGTPGFRNLAPTFGAVYATPDSFDNKDGTLIVAVNTAAAGIPAGQGVLNYNAILVRVTATHYEGVFNYDPTYDAWRTYLAPSDPLHLPDSDLGRPLEIYGVGLRNGYVGPLQIGGINPPPAGPPVFEERERHCEGCAGMGQAVRNAFPWDPGAVDPQGDVSNNVRRRPPLTGGGFETFPWAIGTSTSGVLPGALVPQGSFNTSHGETFEFEIDTSDPDVLAYVRQGLNNGVLAFAITSMHDAEQQVSGSTPNFYTRESTDLAAIDPTIEVVATVPEPGFAAGLLGSCSALALLDRRRARRRGAN